MRTKDKIISILISIICLISPGLLLGVGFDVIFSIPWWSIMCMGAGLQWLYFFWKNKRNIETQLKNALDQYESLDYKKYLVPLKCQACGRDNSVELDLYDTEFKCKSCDKKNAIYINFSTASITDPLLDPNDFIANAT